MFCKLELYRYKYWSTQTYYIYKYVLCIVPYVNVLLDCFITPPTYHLISKYESQPGTDQLIKLMSTVHTIRTCVVFWKVWHNEKKDTAPFTDGARKHIPDINGPYCHNTDSWFQSGNIQQTPKALLEYSAEGRSRKYAYS